VCENVGKRLRSVETTLHSFPARDRSQRKTNAFVVSAQAWVGAAKDKWEVIEVYTSLENDVR
jgi:hypothetical protein